MFMYLNKQHTNIKVTNVQVTKSETLKIRTTTMVTEQETAEYTKERTASTSPTNIPTLANISIRNTIAHQFTGTVLIKNMVLSTSVTSKKLFALKDGNYDRTQPETKRYTHTDLPVNVSDIFNIRNDIYMKLKRFNNESSRNRRFDMFHILLIE